MRPLTAGELRRWKLNKSLPMQHPTWMRCLADRVGYGPPDDGTVVAWREVLLMVIALELPVGGDDMQANTDWLDGLLDDSLSVLLDELLLIYDALVDLPETDVPAFQIMIADHQYMTWTGYDSWQDLGLGGGRIDRLARPPILAVSLHVPGAFFRALNEVEEYRRVAATGH